MEEQDLVFYLDDSGTFHSKEKSGFFVYAGYVFVDKGKQNDAKRKYINANKKLKKFLKRNDELKASSLEPKHRRALLTPLDEYEKVAVSVEINRVYNHILGSKKARCRYKDYAIKRCLKLKVHELINAGIIDKNRSLHIKIFIDQQLTATDGYYDLRDSITEELQHGVVGFDYGRRIPNTIDANVKTQITYCDSANNYLIQAADILANRIWTSYKDNRPELRNLNHLSLLTLP